MLEGQFGSINYRGEFLDNFGGARLFRFAADTHFSRLAPGIQGVVVGSNTLIDPFGWQQWEPIEDTADLQESEGEDDGGPLYTNVFRCELARDTIGKRMVIDSVVRKPIIAEVTDNNGQVRRMGEIGDPAYMTVEHNTGRGMAARSGWVITIEWRSRRPLYYVDPTFEPVLANGLPEDDSLTDASGALGG